MADACGVVNKRRASIRRSCGRHCAGCAGWELLRSSRISACGLVIARGAYGCSSSACVEYATPGRPQLRHLTYTQCSRERSVPTEDIDQRSAPSLDSLSQKLGGIGVGCWLRNQC
jgi:hypothetical protein